MILAEAACPEIASLARPPTATNSQPSEMGCYCCAEATSCLQLPDLTYFFLLDLG